MAEGVITTGLEEMRRAIDAFPKAVETALQRVAHDTASRILARARARVPVATGYTRDHIVLVEDLPHRAYRVEAGPPINTREHPALLPVYLEFGTRYMSARPFMRPAIDAEREPYQRRLEQASAQIAQQVFR